MPLTIVVLSERIGEDSRHAALTVNDDGSIAIMGHELGPSVEIISSDGEFEWFLDVSASDAHRVDVDAMAQAMIDSGTPFSTARAWLDEAAVPYTYYSV